MEFYDRCPVDREFMEHPEWKTENQDMIDYIDGTATIGLPWTQAK